MGRLGQALGQVGLGLVRVIERARLQQGVRIEQAQLAPDVLVSALGTTWKKANRDEAAFQAVDLDLVVQCAEGASDARVRQFIGISSVGADRFSKNLYLRTKGEMEGALSRLRLRRLDILRPGLLRGHRETSRPLEGVGQVLAPVADLLLHGQYRRFRSISAQAMARAILALARQKAGGHFIHDWDGIQLVLRRAGG